MLDYLSLSTTQKKRIRKKMGKKAGYELRPRRPPPGFPALGSFFFLINVMFSKPCPCCGLPSSPIHDTFSTRTHTRDASNVCSEITRNRESAFDTPWPFQQWRIEDPRGELKPGFKKNRGGSFGGYESHLSLEQEFVIVM